MSLAAMIYKALRIRNDMNAIWKGKAGKRLVNKVNGRIAGKAMRR